MIRLRSFFSLIKNTGLDLQSTPLGRMEVVLSNMLSMLSIPLSILGLVLGLIYGNDVVVVGCSVIWAFSMLVFPLNHKGKVMVSSFGQSVIPPLLLLLPGLLTQVALTHNNLSLSFIFIAISIIPLFLIQQQKNYGILTAALLCHLVILLFYDVCIVWEEQGFIDSQVIEENYALFKLPQVLMWALIVFAFQYMKSKLNSVSNMLINTEKALSKAEVLTNQLDEELSIHKEIIGEREQKMEEQNARLRNTSNELESTKFELLRTIDRLSLAKHKYALKSADIRNIMNALNEHFLVAQYDLNGNLLNISTKVVDLLGVLHDDHFKNAKPINKMIGSQSSRRSIQYLSGLWNRIKKGEAHTVELEYNAGQHTKYMSTTFVPLLDQDRKPHQILAIGLDISEFVKKDETIRKMNEELKAKNVEIDQKNELLNFQQKEIFDKSQQLHLQHSGMQKSV